MSTTDDVVVRLRLADIAKFVADVKAGTLSIDGLERKIKSAGTVAKAQSTEYGGLGLWGATVGRVKYAVAGLALTLGAGVGALGAFAVKSVATFEQANIGFKSLLGSQDAATKMINDLEEFNKKSPFELPDIEGFAQSLLAAEAPADRIVSILTAMGDAAAEFGGGAAAMGGITTALTQISMSGHLMKQDLNQLVQWKINAIPWLAEALGVTQPQVLKMIEQGKIGSAKAISIILAGMESHFGGAAEAQSHSLIGIWSNMHDAVEKVLRRALLPFLPAVEVWLQRFVDKVPTYEPKISKFFGSIGSGFKSIYDVITSSGVVRLLGDVWNAIKWLFDKTIGPGGIMGLVNWLGSTPPSGDTNASMVSKFANALAAVVENTFVQNTLKGLALYTLGMKAFGIATDTATASVARFKTAMAFLAIPGGGKLSGPSGMLGRGIPTLTGAVAMKALIPEALLATAIVATAGAIAYHFSSEFRKRWDGMWRDMTSGSALSRIGGFFRGVGSFLGAAFKNGFMDSVHMFEDIGHAIWTALTFDLGSALKSGVIGVFNWLVDKWNSLADAMSFSIPGTSTGVHFGHVDKIDGAAGGGTTSSSGPLWVGERGPELLNLPRGANVIPLPRVPEFTGGGMSRRPVHTHVYLDRKQIALAVSDGFDDLAATA